MKKFALLPFILFIGLGLVVLSGHGSVAQDRAVKGGGINKAALSDSEMDLVAGGAVIPDTTIPGDNTHCTGLPCNGSGVTISTGSGFDGNTGNCGAAAGKTPPCTVGNPNPPSLNGTPGTKLLPNGGNGGNGKDGTTPTIGNPLTTPPPNPSSTTVPNGKAGGSGGNGFSPGASKTNVSIGGGNHCTTNGLSTKC